MASWLEKPTPQLNELCKSHQRESTRDDRWTSAVLTHALITHSQLSDKHVTIKDTLWSLTQSFFLQSVLLSKTQMFWNKILDPKVELRHRDVRVYCRCCWVWSGSRAGLRMMNLKHSSTGNQQVDTKCLTWWEGQFISPLSTWNDLAKSRVKRLKYCSLSSVSGRQVCWWADIDERCWWETETETDVGRTRNTREGNTVEQ